jgi:Tetratricopeptide repeat
MCKSILNKTIILFICITAPLLKAQTKLNSAYVDSASYAYFHAANWNELKNIGNKAISAGIDYYYLRLRLGIAYYNQKKYALAIPHFQKALTQNSMDALALQYLYFAYIFAERYDEAEKLSKLFDDELMKITQAGLLSQLKYISIEGGLKNAAKKQYANRDINKVQFTDEFDPAYYAQLAINHSLRRRFFLTHAFTYSSQGENHNRILPQTSTRERFITQDFRYDTINKRTLTDITDKAYYKTTFMQYYLQVGLLLKNGISISPSFQYVLEQAISNTERITQNTIFDTIHHRGPPPPSLPPPPEYKNYTQSGSASKDSSYQKQFQVYSLEISKCLKATKLDIGFLYTNFSDKTQFQNLLSLKYSVNGKNKLKLGLDWYNQFTNGKFSYAYAPVLMFNPTNKWRFYAKYFTNQFDKNSSLPFNKYDLNGLYLNNIYGNIQYKFTGMIDYSITSHIALYLVYTYEKNLLNFIKPENNNEIVLPLTYAYNGFFGGIRISNFKKR